jgi:hypothetical protein
MRIAYIVVAAMMALSSRSVMAEEPATPRTEGKQAPLVLRTRVALPSVYGRIDHFGWDTKRGLLIVSALGNDTLEIVANWKRVHTITGLEHPQASVYIPGVDRIAVSSQSGNLRCYDAANYALVQTIDFGNDANTDNMRYDPSTKRLYVGYGAGARGAIAVVDPASMERVEEYKVGTHPESFQLETRGPRILSTYPDRSLSVLSIEPPARYQNGRFQGTATFTPWLWTSPASGCSPPPCSPDV